ncbi:Fic family protein [Myroides marinus]|uniref:Fic family protein n=1 Tax=Myroides marinus TaxID=703342 RepID=UPI002576E4FD|nr:Fic family protein [Myroides marinus]MDM1383715.1 Fic family protein [Myroides marinus]
MNYTQTKLAIDQLIQKAQSYGQLSSEQLKRLNHKFRLEWNYNSNSMEGNTLTVAETRSVMIGNLDVQRKPLKDVLEVKGHDEVISEILRIGKGEIRLSKKRIKEIHKGIMYEEDPALRDKIGIWKQEANEIINHKGEKYLFVLPEEIPEKIHDLLNRTNAKIDLIQMGRKDAPHPVDVALSFHLEYLNIHPFYDGNGRTARILSNLILVALGYPPFWITENERGIYYRYIADIQCYGGRKDDLFNYMGELILRSQQMICDVLDGKSIEDEDDIDKEIELLKRELKAKKGDKEVIKRSNIVIKELFDIHISELFNRYIEKGQLLKDTCYSINYELLVNDRAPSSSMTTDIIDDQIELEFLNESWYISKKVNSISIRLNFKGALNGAIELFSSAIHVEFKEFKFIVYNIVNKEVVSLREFIYNDNITKEINSSIINENIRRVLAVLKQQIS